MGIAWFGGFVAGWLVTGFIVGQLTKSAIEGFMSNLQTQVKAKRAYYG